MTVELLSRNSHLRTVLESISEGILEISAGKVVYANQTACRLFGLPQEKMLSVTPEALFENSAANRVRRLLDTTTTTAVAIGTRVPLQLLKKRVRLRCLPAIGENTVILMLSDVTERLAIEKELHKYRDHLERLVEKRTADLTRTTKKLHQAQKLEAIGTLARGIANDLNNVLAGIISYPELLLAQIGPDDTLVAPLQTIKKSGEKAVAIVQDLLNLANRGVSASEVVSLNETILASLDSPEFQKLQAYHPTVKVQTDLMTDLPHMLGSPRDLSRALMNLVSNAVAAMPSGGGITITTQVRHLDRPLDGYPDIDAGEYIEVTVTDTGVGISENDITRIFEPFYTKNEMGRSGTGLGMAVVWGTVKDHQGYIDVESIMGQGTTFSLYFPVPRQLPEKKPATVLLEQLRGNGESVLVVDDMPEQLEIATGMLTELGYQVAKADSGEAAVSYLQTHTVDLLLDMIMTPGRDGLETYRKILTAHPHQKAVVSSGFSATDRVREAHALGAGQFLRKPFSIQALGISVKKALQGKTNEA